MCGICGYSGQQSVELMQKMLDCMRHRGPDENGHFVSADKNISLGMVRLSIIDREGGSQPMVSEDGKISVVFNGEIYNYIELRKELEDRGHRFRTSSDTETIVHAYEEYGLEFPNKLNGMFSICVWDERVKKMVLVRDRFGIKPLFYRDKFNSIIFGSEIKVLLHHPDVRKDIDYEALSHYFALRNIPAPFTIYKDIRVLLPGHMLIWEGGDAHVSRWYQLSMNASWKECDEELLVDRIDALLQDSVKLRLRSDVEYGAYLSGGIDSSTIVALMSSMSSKPVKTFNLSFADAPDHKRDPYYARKVAELYSTDHHEYSMKWSELAGELTDVIGHLDQPFAGVISSYWLSRFMKENVTVALSGDGADDIFASYGHHRLVGPVQNIQRAHEEGRPIQDVDLGYFKDRKEFAVDMAQYHQSEWRLAYAAFMSHEKEQLFSPSARELMGSYSTSNFLSDVQRGCGGDVDELNRMLYLDIHTLLHNEILYFNDMLSMAHSMEVRTPFLDYRLVELASSIPGSLKIKNLTLKYILRRVAERYLPQEIIDRPKEGFVLPKNTWLRQGMSSMMESVLSTDRIAAHGYFNQSYVDLLMQNFARGDDSITFKIWSMIVFQLWYESHGI